MGIGGRPEPAKGEVLLKHTAVGLNLADTYRRTGLYPIKMPSGIGNEAVGVVEAVGPGTRGVKVGDRVGYIGGMPLDGYSQRRVAPVSALIPLPEFVDDRTAAASAAQGHHGPVSAAGFLPGEERRHDRRACRGRRCRSDHVPVGECHRGDGHRHREFAGESGYRREKRLPSPHRGEAQKAEIRQEGSRADRRAGRPLHLRFRGQGHLGRITRQRAPARVGHQLRQRLGQAAENRYCGDRRPRLALSRPLRAGELYGHPRRNHAARSRSFQGHRERRCEDQRQSALQAERRRPGPQGH